MSTSETDGGCVERMAASYLARAHCQISRALTGACSVVKLVSDFSSQHKALTQGNLPLQK